MSLPVNKIAIAVDPVIANFWITKFPDLADMFDTNSFLNLLMAPDSYRPIWQAPSVVDHGYHKRYVDFSCHKLEGFDVNLATECQCASVYYLLRDLEEASKGAACRTYVGFTIFDYMLPDLADIKADLDFTTRQCLIEIEATAGSTGLGTARSQYGTKLMFQILHQDPLRFSYVAPTIP